MWFRRKKKPDPDSALTETLRSLQVLLEDENSSELRKESEVKPAQDQIAADTDLSSKQPSSEQGKLPAAVEINADENRSQAKMEGSLDDKQSEREFYLNSSTAGPGKKRTDAHAPTETSQAVAVEHPAINDTADLRTESPTEKKSEKAPPWVDPFKSDDEQARPEEFILELPQEDLAQDNIVIPAIDTIPVLNNVVYEPAELKADAISTSSAELNRLIDSAVKNLKAGLAQLNLPTMDEAQEKTLRQTLANILSTKNIGTSL